MLYFNYIFTIILKTNRIIIIFLIEIEFFSQKDKMNYELQKEFKEFLEFS